MLIILYERKNGKKKRGKEECKILIFISPYKFSGSPEKIHFIFFWKNIAKREMFRGEISKIPQESSPRAYETEKLIQFIKTSVARVKASFQCFLACIIL